MMTTELGAEQQPKMTLEQKLAAFDPARHSGEFVAAGSVGAERFNDHSLIPGVPGRCNLERGQPR